MGCPEMSRKDSRPVARETRREEGSVRAAVKAVFA